MIWGLTCYFNPAGFEKPAAHLRTFSKRVRNQGLPLAIVELAFGDQAFSLDESMCDMLIQLRSDEVLWHKEALLNIGIAQLPAECDKVCWLDADILFDNPDWVALTDAALEHHRVVQPYSHCIWLPPDVETVDESLTTYPALNDEFSRIHSFGFGWSNFGRHALEARILYGHVGFAWAARRELIKSIGLYDADIHAGSGDNFMAHAFVGHEAMLRVDGAHYSEALLSHYQQWASRAYEQVAGDVAYVDGTVKHLWHGASANRRYLERLLLLREVEFDPSRHLRRCDNGLYRLHDAPARLREAISGYFHTREEDRTTVPGNPCNFGEGFHDPEGPFRWARRHARLKINRDLDEWTFSLSNNALNRFAVPQTIGILRNDVPLTSVLLHDTGKVDVEIGRVSAGESFSFVSDFEFRPIDLGENDHRDLSFMIW